MAIGDLTNLTISGIGNCVPHYVNIYESIFNSYGPAADVRTVDSDDSASQIKGNEDIEIKFSVDGGGSSSFKLKSFTGKNLTDHSSDQNTGSLKNKQYTVRCISPEALNAQGNYIEKSWEDKTTKIAEDVLKNNYKTDKQITTEDQGKEKRVIRAQNEHPKNFMQKLNDQHVSSSSKSSAYVVFQEQDNGNQQYKITTFEKLFEKSPVGKWTQRADLDSSSASENDKRNSIMWFNAGENFNMAADHLKATQDTSFNRDTHSPFARPKPQQNNYKYLGKEVRPGQSPQSNAVPVSTMVSLTNEKQSTTVAEARANKKQFLARLAENSATFEIPGNSNVKLGSIMELDIPKRSATGGGKERQFNGKVCVVEIRHKIRPPGQVPRYTMVIRAVKAAHEG